MRPPVIAVTYYSAHLSCLPTAQPAAQHLAPERPFITPAVRRCDVGGVLWGGAVRVPGNPPPGALLQDDRAFSRSRAST